MLTLLLLAAVAFNGAQAWATRTTELLSCRNYCGYDRGSCSCTSSCVFNGNCCSDFEYYCFTTHSTTQPPTTTSAPHTAVTHYDHYSCRNNCGFQLAVCSCTSSCQYNGNCCPDFNSYCDSATTTFQTTAQPSCLYNCNYDLGSCSCESSCQYYGNCCNDYYDYCSYRTTTIDVPITTTDAPTTAQPSCINNCGSHLGSCSCTSSCQHYGNCCQDFYGYCDTGTTRNRETCRYNCGYDLGRCSCKSSCRRYGNCCSDYNHYCSYTTQEPTTDMPSCRYNCGYNLGRCSCKSSCRSYGNCCSDYNNYCSYTTQEPTTDMPSCRYNCGYDMGNCSCRSSCHRYGNCCNDYYNYCSYTTREPTTVANKCGGSLFGSGSFSSPNYPYYYQDNSYCVWQLSAASDQNIYLRFTYLQLENCCSCDYIAVYDGPSVGSRFLGKVCNDSQTTFHSSSNYLTVLFRTDSSVVGRGFNAEFTSSLSSGLGRVDCSSDNMNIVVSKSYLNSLGIDANNLYLNDQYCRPSISYYSVVFNFPINTCGTVREFDRGRIVYTNALRAFNSNYGQITRQSLFRLNVSCRMEQDSVSQIIYEVRHHDNVSISGSGRFNTSMAFYTSGNFYYQVTQVPYLVSLNQDLYVQVSLRRGDSTLVVFLDTCVASPSPHDFQTRSYDLIRNGCRVDSTFYSYSSGTRPYARFRFKAFQFLRATDHVYIQCKVLICPASDYNSRCRRGCSRRVARELSSEHESETVVLGPIQLQKSEKKKEEA